MRRFLARLTVAGLLAGCLGVLSAGAAQAVVTCNNTPQTALTGTINDNVVVPPGAFCYITAATVNGNVTVQSGGNLDVHDSTIKGSITATNPFGFGLTNTTVYGPVSVNGTTPGGGYFICGSTLNSSLTIQNSNSSSGYWQIGQFNFCPANTFKGNVTFLNNGNQVIFQGNTVGGSVVARNNLGFGDIEANTITGNLTVTNNNPCWNVFGNTVKGSQNVDPCSFT
jgi:hypothetical protein